MAVSHVFTNAIPDGTNTQIVRPSDWNSAHNIVYDLVGNTAGVASVSGTNVVFAGGPNVTLSAAQGANAATVSFSGGAGAAGNTGYLSAGTTNASLGTVSFANGSGVTWGINGQTLTASVKTDYLTTAMASNRGSDFVQATAAFNGTNASGTIASNAISVSVAAQSVQPVAASAANGSAAFSTLSFSNANGVSFQTAAGPAIVATVKTDYAASDHSHGNPTLALTNLSGTTASNSAGFTLSLSAGAGGAGDGVNILAAGTQTANTTGTVVFSNSNGISFGMSNSSVITASYTVPTQTNQTLGGYFVGNTTGQSSSSTWDARTLSIDGAGIVSAGWSNGTMRISATQSNQAFSADASSTFQTLSFQNSNGVSFSNNAGALRVTHDLQFTSATSAITSNALHSSASRVINIVAATNNAGGGTASLSSNVSFSAANGLTFYTSAGNAIVGSYTVPTQTNQSVGDYALGNTTGQSSSSTWDARSLSFAGAGIVSVGNSAGSGLIISATQSNQAFSAGAASSTFQTLSFQDSNGLSFSNNAGAIRVSYTRNVASNAIQAVGSATGSGTNTSRFAADDHVHAGVFSIGVSTGGNTAGDTRVDVGRFVLAGGANITLSQATAAGALNTISIVGGAGGGGAAISGGANSQSTGTVNFANSNGITFGLSNNGTMTASFDPINVGVSNLGNTAGTTGTMDGRAAQLVFVGGNNVTMSQSSAASVMTITVSAPDYAVSNSAGSFTFKTLNFSNANNVTFGTSAGGVVTASVAAPGAAAENNWVNLSGNTAGNTTASGSTVNFSGINITLSGTNGSQIAFSAPATSSLSATGQVSISSNGSTISIGVPAQFTNSYYNPQDAYVQVTGQQGQASLHIQPCKAPNVQFDRFCFPVQFSGATNSTNSLTISMWAGIYTKNNNTLSLSTSFSTSQGITHSGTANSTINSGPRLMTMGATHTLTEGQYWVGILSRTTTGGGANSISQFLCSQANSNFSGLLGVASAASAQYTRGLGHYSQTTTGIPSSIAFSDLRGTASIVLRQPAFYFLSQTV